MEKILYSNCSEAVYKISGNLIDSLSNEAKGVFYQIVESCGSINTLNLCGDAITRSNDIWSSNPYFENTELDLFLDYFNVQSERTHWTCGATSSLDKETYTKLMKEFCEKYNLIYKDIYERRYKDE